MCDTGDEEKTEKISPLNVEIESTGDEKLRYTLTQIPPVPILLSAALQHILMNLVFSLTTAFIVADIVCAPYDSPFRTRLFSSTLLMSGICTLLQTTFGVRLPIYQGPSASFFPALLALKNNIGWQCSTGNSTEWGHSGNGTNISTPIYLVSADDKLRQLSGSLMASSIFEIVIGGTGLVGFLLRFIGPVTVGPTIALIGISLYKIPIAQARPSWEIAFGGIALVLLFSLYIPHVQIPVPSCGKKKISYVPLFQLLPVLLSIMVMWGISGIMTITNVFPDDKTSLRYRARTDSRLNMLELTPWFLFPYPGQFGAPSFSLAAFVGFLTGFSASMIESVGDYFAAAKACQVDPPPDHAVNRGILMEGLSGLLGGAIGTGHATTSYSGNISALTMSKTVSRSVMLCCGVMLIVFAILGKFGAAIALTPDPALAGVMVVLSGMLVSLGLSTLRHVNMNTSRNQTIIGVSLFIGIFLPEWVDRYPDFINTGVVELDGVLKVALGTPMFVGGVTSIFLDNTVKGSREDRGLVSWKLSHQAPASAQEDKTETGVHSDVTQTYTYEWRMLPSIYSRLHFLSKLPFMPPIRDTTTHEHSTMINHHSTTKC